MIIYFTEVTNHGSIELAGKFDDLSHFERFKEIELYRRKDVKHIVVEQTFQE